MSVRGVYANIVLLPLLLSLAPGVGLKGGMLRAQGHSLVSPRGEVEWNRYYPAGEVEQ